MATVSGRCVPRVSRARFPGCLEQKHNRCSSLVQPRKRLIGDGRGSNCVYFVAKRGCKDLSSFLSDFLREEFVEKLGRKDEDCERSWRDWTLIGIRRGLGELDQGGLIIA